MKTIHLTQGKVTLVDDDDFEWLSQFTWRAKQIKMIRRPNLWYAYRSVNHDQCIGMHVDIANRSMNSKYPQCDHKDGDGLNNQKSNLRPCTSAQNNWNRRKAPGQHSKFKGVSWHRRDLVWVAKIMCHHKAKWLGSFKNEHVAALAYDAAAKKLFGDFARLNFP